MSGQDEMREAREALELCRRALIEYSAALDRETDPNTAWRLGGQAMKATDAALRSRLFEPPSASPLSLLPLLRDVEEALADLGACDNPYCTDCPRVLPRVRAAIREHAAGTEPTGRIR